jgi:hypothetical protein
VWACVGVCLSLHALLVRILAVIVSFPVHFLHFTFGKGITSSSISWRGEEGGCLGPRIFWTLWTREKSLAFNTTGLWQSCVTKWYNRLILDIFHRLNLKKRQDVSVAGCASIFRKRSALLGGLPRSSYSQSLGTTAKLNMFRYALEECKVYGVRGIDVSSGAYLSTLSFDMVPSDWE